MRGCGVSPHQANVGGRSALTTRSLADVLVFLRCHECGARPRSIHLAETAHRTGLGMPKGIDLGWALLLHG
jgi:hypothetical protein